MGKRKELTKEEKEKIEIAKQELKDYRENIKYIEEKMNDTEELKTKLEKITTILSITKTNTSNTETDKFADGINRLEDLKIDCNKKMEDLIVKKFAIDQKIETLKQPYRNILFFRYTRGKSWEKVAEDLGYTKDYTCELHGKALYLYSKI
jgi:DNA-directed RNA polymerase specialized sigma subunit